MYHALDPGSYLIKVKVHNLGLKVKKLVLSISPTVLHLGSQNMVCDYILGWQNVAYYLKVYMTMTLTFDLNHQKTASFSLATLARIIKYV